MSNHDHHKAFRHRGVPADLADACTTLSHAARNAPELASRVCCSLLCLVARSESPGKVAALAVDLLMAALADRIAEEIRDAEATSGDKKRHRRVFGSCGHHNKRRQTS